VIHIVVPLRLCVSLSSLHLVPSEPFPVVNPFAFFSFIFLASENNSSSSVLIVCWKLNE